MIVLNQECMSHLYTAGDTSWLLIPAHLLSMIKSATILQHNNLKVSGTTICDNSVTTLDRFHLMPSAHVCFYKPMSSQSCSYLPIGFTYNTAENATNVASEYVHVEVKVMPTLFFHKFRGNNPHYSSCHLQLYTTHGSQTLHPLIMDTSWCLLQSCSISVCKSCNRRPMYSRSAQYTTLCVASYTASYILIYLHSQMSRSPSSQTGTHLYTCHGHVGHRNCSIHQAQDHNTTYCPGPCIAHGSLYKHRQHACIVMHDTQQYRYVSQACWHTYQCSELFHHRAEGCQPQKRCDRKKCKYCS